MLLPCWSYPHITQQHRPTAGYTCIVAYAGIHGRTFFSCCSVNSKFAMLLIRLIACSRRITLLKKATMMAFSLQSLQRLLNSITPKLSS